jgi:hypothetical protein
MTRKEILGPAHTGTWFERNTAEPVQDSTASTAAEFVPHLISHHSREDRCPNRHVQRHLTGAHQCTGGDQKQKGRDRKSDLFRKNNDEEYEGPVLRQKLK